MNVTVDIPVSDDLASSDRQARLASTSPALHLALDPDRQELTPDDGVVSQRIVRTTR